MAHRNFYFGKDADIVAGSANFAAKILTDFALYGISNAQSTFFGTLNTTLQDKYTLAINPDTRTPIAIGEKDLAIKNMRANAVMLAKICYGTPTVTDPMLESLGLLPRASRTPRRVPSEPPVVEYVSCVNRLVTIKLHGAAPDSRRGKPFGAQSANIFTFVGAEPPSDPQAFTYQGVTTRPTAEIQFPNSVANGAKVWISACWVSARGEQGLGCQPISCIIQGGEVVPAAG